METSKRSRNGENRHWRARDNNFRRTPGGSLATNGSTASVFLLRMSEMQLFVPMISTVLCVDRQPRLTLSSWEGGEARVDTQCANEILGGCTTKSNRNRWWNWALYIRFIEWDWSLWGERLTRNLNCSIYNCIIIKDIRKIWKSKYTVRFPRQLSKQMWDCIW